VWQALDADPRTVSARSAAQRLNQLGRACHLVWNPIHGETVQLIPILRAGRSLGWPNGLNPLALLTADPGAIWGSAPQPPAEPEPGAAAVEAAEVNAEGRLCLQICVVAFAWDPFTSRPMTGLTEIMDWLDSWGVPREWPAGPPAAFPHEQAGCRDRRLWARGGHFGVSQVPDLTAAGPGAIDIELLTGWVGQPRPPEPAAAGRVTLPRPRREPAGAGAKAMRDLDGYFDNRDADTAAGTLSRVG